MNTAIGALRQTIDVTWLLLQAGTRNLAGHWALAVFSIVVASGTWFIIQDVENPRVQGLVPPDGEQAIRVEYVNASDDVTVVEASTVLVLVEAREERLSELRASDFRAVVDLQGLTAGATVERPVTVTSSDRDVRVIEVEPATVSVQLVAVVEEEFEVEIRQTAPLPDGYELADAPVIEPQFVTVRGTPELVNNVDRVTLDVNFSGKRADFELPGDLVARNANDQPQTVTLSTKQATVSFSIDQTIQQREFSVRPQTSGMLAPGYYISAIQMNPRIIRVNASDDVLEGITELVLEPMDVAGASGDLIRTVRIRPIQNVILTPDQVEVTVVIEPIPCDDIVDTECATSIALVQPTFVSAPAGLTVGPGIYFVRIELRGTPVQLADLQLADITATISLTGLAGGSHTLTPQVVVPQGVTAVGVNPVVVTLVANP